jgi:hypothetical protein
MRKNIDQYVANDNDKSNAAAYDRKWIRNVEIILSGINKDNYDAVKTTKYLIEIRDMFSLIAVNINDRIASEERVLLKNIFSTSIQIINSALITKEYSKLAIVQATLNTMLDGWKV